MDSTPTSSRLWGMRSTTLLQLLPTLGHVIICSMCLGRKVVLKIILDKAVPITSTKQSSKTSNDPTALDILKDLQHSAAFQDFANIVGEKRLVRCLKERN